MLPEGFRIVHVGPLGLRDRHHSHVFNSFSMIKELQLSQYRVYVSILLLHIGLIIGTPRRGAREGFKGGEYPPPLKEMCLSLNVCCNNERDA